MRYYFSTIKGKIVASVVLIHTILMLVFIFDNLARESILLKEFSSKRAHAIGTATALNASYWLLGRDLVALDELISGLRLADGFHSAFVLDVQGRVVASSDSSFINYKLTDNISKELLERVKTDNENHSQINHHGLIDTIHPIISGGVNIGFARLVFDDSEVESALKGLLIKGLLYALVAIVLGAITAWVLMEMMSKRIRVLTGGAAQIAAGKLKVQLPTPKGYDEIDMLTRALTKMQSEITHKIDQLNRINEELENKVEEGVIRRRQQEQILIQQSKMAAMGEMMSAIAHQWRQPLNALVLLVQDLEDAYNYNQLDKAYMRESVQKTLDIASFMSSTIDDFRNFFKPTKEASKFDLIAAITDVLNIVNTQLKNNNITVEFDKPIDPVFVWGYLNEFKHVVVNIINNARQAIIDAKIAGVISIKIEVFDHQTKIIICDNGVGIDSKLYSKIFEPYYTTKQDLGGTGIGLYMSKIIIENNMKGKLEILPVSKGACFAISLPQEQEV